jgi:dnd system-associated protein 4
MRDVRRPDAFEPLVDRLTSAKLTDNGQPVFQTIMDLLIFAASVGLMSRRRVLVPASGKAIPIRIFQNNEKDGYIYLVALAEKKDGSMLSPESDDEIVKTFEEYAAGGLEEIGSWLMENPTDISGVRTLVEKIQAQIPKTPSELASPSPI